MNTAKSSYNINGQGDSYIPTNNATTEECQASPIVRLKAAKELMEAHALLPSNEWHDKEMFNREIGRLLLDVEQHNISAQYLKSEIVKDYIFDASAALKKSMKAREIFFPVRRKDEDLLDTLKENWEKQGFVFRRLTTDEEARMGNRNEYFYVSLKWC